VQLLILYAKTRIPRCASQPFLVDIDFFASLPPTAALSLGAVYPS
jgi:hypothetical protein